MQLQFDGSVTITEVGENTAIAVAETINTSLPMIVVQEGIVDPEQLDENGSPTVVQERIEMQPPVQVTVQIAFPFPLPPGALNIGDEFLFAGSGGTPVPPTP